MLIKCDTYYSQGLICILAGEFFQTGKKKSVFKDQKKEQRVTIIPGHWAT